MAKQVSINIYSAVFARLYTFSFSLPCRGVSIPSWTNSGSISSYQLSKSKHLAGQEREASPQHWHANQRFEALAQVTEEASVCVSRNNVSRRTVVMCGSHESQTHSQQTSSWNLESPRIGKLSTVAAWRTRSGLIDCLLHLCFLVKRF